VNIGNPIEVTIIELALLIRDLTGSSSPIEHVPRPEDDPMIRRPDITLARSTLGWAPQVDLADGLTRTITWFRHAVDHAARSTAR